MKTSKFTEEQIAFTLKQVEPGTPAKEAIRKEQLWGERNTIWLIPSAIIIPRSNLVEKRMRKCEGHPQSSPSLHGKREGAGEQSHRDGRVQEKNLFLF